MLCYDSALLCPQSTITQVCLPTIVKDCGPVALKERKVMPDSTFAGEKQESDTVAMQVKGKESCVEVARTVCTEVSEYIRLRHIWLEMALTSAIYVICHCV